MMEQLYINEFINVTSYGASCPVIIKIDIDNDAIEDAKSRFGDSNTERDQMALQNIQNSQGLNLGVKWIENSEGAFGTLETLPKKIREMAINHDAYVMNPDRDESNSRTIEAKCVK